SSSILVVVWRGRDGLPGAAFLPSLCLGVWRYLSPLSVSLWDATHKAQRLQERPSQYNQSKDLERERFPKRERAGHFGCPSLLFCKSTNAAARAALFSSPLATWGERFAQKAVCALDWVLEFVRFFFPARIR
ncbi:unnamed protein product, partial [Ectocarpus sp. 8 AP-2014]